MEKETTELTETPTWIHDMKFCHISCDDGLTWYCGTLGQDGITCTNYEGEAICPICGNPTCPRCAQLEAIDYQLGEP